MTVYAFAISALDTGRLQALAVVAPEARYCSMLATRGTDRIDRRFVPIDGWKAMERELGHGLDAGLWPAASAVAQFLGLSKVHALRYVSARGLEVPAIGAADVLDAFLRSQLPEKG